MDNLVLLNFEQFSYDFKDMFIFYIDLIWAFLEKALKKTIFQRQFLLLFNDLI
jgi:hypothetical protein